MASEGVLDVTDSLLAMKLTDDELAGVLAHEIAHGIDRHTSALDDLLAGLASTPQESAFQARRRGYGGPGCQDS